MRIASSSISDNIVRQIQQLGYTQTRLQDQVATGQRITNPDDDPAAMARVINLESERRNLEQFSRNADRALEVSLASFSGLQQIKSVSDRVTEIATLGSSASSPAALDAFAAEVDQLLEQGVQLANTRFRNDYIFAGTAVDTAPIAVTRDAAGLITTLAYAGDTNQAAIPLSETASLAPGTTGVTNQGLADFLNQLVALRDALRAGGGAAVSTIQTGLIASEDLLVDSLAAQGAVQTRIEVNQTQQQDRAQNLENLVSAEADADLPTTIVKLNQSQTAYQAALQSAANILRLSLLDFIQ